MRVVAGVIADAVEDPRPRLRYPVGKGAGLLARLRAFLPARMFDRSLRAQFHVEA